MGNIVARGGVISLMACRWNAGSLVCLFLLAQPAAAEDKACAAMSSVSDVQFTLAIKDHAAVFQHGEIIPLELSFTATTKDRYWADARNYDRSGRLGIEEYCVEPEAPDPLATYFQSGGFIGGGLGSIQALSATPFRAAAELNEWHSLAPGHYRVYAISHRVWRPPDPHDETPYGRIEMVVRSNTIELDVNRPNPAWQSEQLRSAAETLAHPASPDEAKHAARVLRFLNTKESTTEMARLFWGLNEQQPTGWDLMFGLYGSPYRQEAIEAMRAQLAAPDHAITGEFLSALVRLQVSADPAWSSPPKDPKEAQEFWKRRQEHSDELTRADIRAVMAALPSKTVTARAQTLHGLLTYSGTDPTLARTIRPVLIAAWPDLPYETQEELIEGRWPLIAGADMLPILRRMLAEPAPPGHRFQPMVRDAELKHLYELDPAAGGEAILKDLMSVDGHVSLDNLKLLSKGDVAKALPPVLAGIGKGDARLADYQLVELFADQSALPVIKTALEAHLGRWACDLQEAMLRYALRVAPEYGIEKTAAVMAARKDTGCYRFLLQNLGAQLPKVQQIAIAALDDPDPEVVQNAAGALSRWGSKEAEPALWARLKQFHNDWAERVDELRPTPNFRDPGSRAAGVEYALVNAIAAASAWVCPPEKLAQIQDMVWTRNAREQVDGWLRGWNQQPAAIVASWFPEDKPTFSVLQYGNLTVDQLCEKVAQLPPGTKLQWLLALGVDPDKQESAFERVRAAAGEYGVIVARQ